MLALDVSGSVNDSEYRLQMNGLADALDSARVRNLLLAGGGHVSLSVFEWSSQNHQSLILPWQDLTTHAVIDQTVGHLRAHGKRRQGLKTAMGRAMQYALGLMQQKPQCWTHTLDISGDGKNNIGPLPRDVARHPDYANITVNALVVRDPDAEDNSITRASAQRLPLYFQSDVIHGPGSFVIEAFGYGDYADAMQRKLEREVGAALMSLLERDKQN